MYMGSFNCSSFWNIFWNVSWLSARKCQLAVLMKMWKSGAEVARASMRLTCLTLALDGVGLVLGGGLHHLLHHISLSVGRCQGNHQEHDAGYAYVHLQMADLQGVRREHMSKPAWDSVQQGVFSFSHTVISSVSDAVYKTDKKTNCKQNIRSDDNLRSEAWKKVILQLLRLYRMCHKAKRSEAAKFATRVLSSARFLS